MNKISLFQECKVGLTSENQSVYFIHKHNKGEKDCGPISRGEKVNKKCNTHL